MAPQLDAPTPEALLGGELLDALGIHAAVLDPSGRILAVNRAWAAFAAANGDPAGDRVGVGADYFAVCRPDPAAARVEDGIRDVLRGAAPAYEHEYPCHGPDVQRWFLMRVLPVALAGGRGAVVAHINVTEREVARAGQRLATDAAARRVRAAADAAALDRMAGTAPAAATARAFGQAPLCEGAPRLFADLVGRYEALLAACVEARLFRVDDDPWPGTRAFAAELGFLGARPRDVVDLHREGLARFADRADDVRVAASVDEGRLLLLAVLGDLVTYYRSRALGGPVASPPPAGVA